MTATDLEMLPEVLALIAEEGTTATLTTAPTVVDGVVTVAGTAHAGVKCVRDDYRAHEIDGNNIQVGDARLYVAASGLAFTPAKDWTATVAGATFRVIAVTTYGQDVAVLYELQVRR